MNNNTIAIVGCGWLGMALAKYLIGQGYKVHGSTTTSEKLKLLKSYSINPWLISLGNQADALPPEFLHAEWLILSLSPGALASSMDMLTSQFGNSEPRRILMISSTAVYPNSCAIVTESDAIHKTSSHSGIDMLALEKNISALGSSTILRPGGLYGPDRHPGRFLSGKSGLKNGLSPVNLIHQEDVIGIISEIIRTDSNPEIFNAVAPAHPTRKSFYTEAAQSAGLPVPEFIEEAKAESFKIVDVKKLTDRLNYTFKHPDPMADLSSGTAFNIT